jgi:hypothetical protein
MSEGDRTISLTTDDTTLPLVDVVTGRGFVTGKSGSGKSNTASVLAEELLSENVPMLIVDTDGEYYGLKEQYEVLHVGGDDHCDVQVRPDHAETIADVALRQRVPTILDVSGFVDADVGRRLVYEVVRELFVAEKTEKTPFLLLVEEAHEFIPEQGGLDEVGEMLVRVAKRGRKRGLGICALSQRPASVDKDYITQCDWLVWHKLTWENDTRVVGKILGADAAESVQTLEPGEAILLTDWDDQRRRVKFRRKATYDAGSTPGLDDESQPDLKAIDADLIDRLQESTSDETDDTGGESDPDAETGSDPDDGARDADPADTDPAASSGRAASGATDTDGQPRTDDSRPDDIEWEIAEFVVYLLRATARLVTGTVRAVGVGVVHVGATVTRGVSQRSWGRGGEETGPVDPFGDVDELLRLVVVLSILVLALAILVEIAVPGLF